MTTIVYCHKTKKVAVDGRMSDNRGLIATDEKDKTIKNEAGLWFLCGVVADHVDIVKLAHNEEASVVPECSALLIKEGCIFSVMVGEDGMCSHEKLTCNDAAGSGLPFALAALDFGKTAKEAVEYAITKDCYSGGKVRVFNLKGEEVE